MKTAIQGPTTWPDIYQNQADRAVDGNINPKLEDGSCSHPLAVDNTNGPWWQVDLGAQFVIVSVNITNRQDQTRKYILGEKFDWTHRSVMKRFGNEWTYDLVKIFVWLICFNLVLVVSICPLIVK